MRSEDDRAGARGMTSRVMLGYRHLICPLFAKKGKAIGSFVYLYVL